MYGDKFCLHSRGFLCSIQCKVIFVTNLEGLRLKGFKWIICSKICINIADKIVNYAQICKKFRNQEEI